MSESQLDWHEPSAWPEDAAPDRLIGDWHIYQRRGGHRTSTDDVLTAWFATHRAVGTPARYLDLGCGVGSVLLMVAHRLRPGRSLGLEAQPQSFAMATRTLEELPAGAPRIELVHGDLRSFDPGETRFELITGSPPYFPLGTGVLPDDAQRRACRFEARGGIEAYCQAAARCIAPGGRFHVVFQTAGDTRVHGAARAAGLHVTARLDTRMRTDRDTPFLTVYELSPRPAATEHLELSIRDDAGEVTAQYRCARHELGVE